MNKIKETKAITLVALVITIIVLLILAGVAINTLMNNGMMDKAKNATQEYENAQDYEETQIAEYTNYIDSYISGNRDVNLTDDVKQYIDDKIAQKTNWTLVWTNENPTQAFAAQDITINLSSYNEIKIAFYAATNSDVICYNESIKGDKCIASAGTRVTPTGVDSININRVYTAQNTKITFDDGVYQIRGSGLGVDVSNSVMIPYKIYAK